MKLPTDDKKLTSEEIGLIAFCMGSHSGNYLKAASEGKITWDEAWKMEAKLRDLMFKVTQL